MSKKTTAIGLLTDYFVLKGTVMSYQEYSKQPDKPISVQALKRTCGSWVRIMAMAERAFPERLAIARGELVAPPPPPPPVDAKAALAAAKAALEPDDE